MRLFPALLHPFPWGVILFAVAVVLGVLWRRALRRLRDDDPGPRCRRCHFSLRGRDRLPASCPECGLDLSTANVIIAAVWQLRSLDRCRAWWVALVLVSTMCAISWMPFTKSLMRHHWVNESYSSPRMATTVLDDKQFYRVDIFVDGTAWFWAWQLPSLSYGSTSPAFAESGLWMHCRVAPAGRPAARRYELRLRYPSLRWSTASPAGNATGSGDVLNEAVIEQWLVQAGYDRSYQGADEESQYIVAYIEWLAGVRGTFPASGLMQGSGTTPLGSRTPCRPFWLLGLIWLIAALVAVRGWRYINKVSYRAIETSRSHPSGPHPSPLPRGEGV